ncbi:MAG: hypothetical protein AB7J28_14265 [Hyphomonadaceae bacterium]
MRSFKLLQAIALVWLAFAGVSFAQSGVRGEPEAVAAAMRILDQAGGAAAWRSRTFAVEERGFLRTGETADLRITRDLTRGARVLERRTPGVHFIEWLSPEEGWSARNGVLTPMSAQELAIELQGLRQEPYAIYHRLANNDADLRVELRDNNSALYVYDRGERLLCWFLIWPNGVMHAWGNFYDGAINQHYYGPTADMGDANLPRWGVALNGAFRFEYVRARMSNEPLAEPEAGEGNG